MTRRPTQAPAAVGTSGRTDLWIAAGLFATTLALRLTFLLRSQDASWPHSVLYEGDAPVWAQWAASLAGGRPFEDDLPFRTPGVAFLLRWCGLAAPPFTLAKALWCALSAATPAALHLAMVRPFGRLAALVASLLTAVSFGSFALSTSLNNEVPYALLVTITIGLTMRWVEAPRVRLAAAIGALHGACMLLRAEHLALLLTLGGWSVVAAWRRGPRSPTAIVQGALVGAIAMLVCVPWMLRSHAAVVRFNREAPAIAYERSLPPWTPGAIELFHALPAFAQGPNQAFLSDIARREGWSQVDEAAVHRFFDERWGSVPEPLPEWSLVSFKGPLDFALSNDLRGDGGFSRAALADAESPDPPFSLARPSHARLVSHGYAVGWASIRADPAKWARLVGEKLRRFVDGATLGLFATDWPHAAPHDRQSIDLAVPRRGDAPVWNAGLLALMAIGVAVATRVPGGGALLAVLAYRLLVIVAFYGYARHAASIGPVLFAFVGLAVQGVAIRIGRARQLQAHARAFRNAGLAACAALTLAAAHAAWNPPVWFARPLVAGGRITPAPHWHADAFEAVDAIAIEPLPPSAR